MLSVAGCALPLTQCLHQGSRNKGSEVWGSQRSVVLAERPCHHAWSSGVGNTSNGRKSCGRLLHVTNMHISTVPRPQVHLFDIDIPGKITFKESETLTPGPSGTVVDTDAGRLGVAICYDLRFPELAMVYARRGVQLIIYPGPHFVPRV